MCESGDTLNRTILDTLRAQGFLTLSAKPSQARAIQAGFDAARHFFQLSENEKAASRLPEGCGYRPQGVEYSRSPALPDRIESFTASIRTRAAARDLRSPPARDLHEVLCCAATELDPSLEELVNRLASEISGRRQTLVTGALRRWSCVQMNHARPSAQAGEFINDLHEDGHLLTLACATAPGLELVRVGGAVLPATTSATEPLVMPGEIAWLLSNGEIPPLYHQVRRDPSCADRLAFLYFCDLDPALCEPWKRGAINGGVDIGSRVRANAARFGVQGFSEE